ncbi:MAG: DUF4340 domain-containing protein [Planctomycetota bacterium]|nr:MAG: DUF4340 domain-containing protein [Planctomycetota bacterium]
MGNKKLTILGIAAALMVIWAVVQSRISNKPPAKMDTPLFLIQGLDPGDIGSITIGTGENAVTLKRQAERFVVANKDNYPAVIGEINKLITSCLDIQTAGLYTDDPANHKDLGVAEENARNVVKFLRLDSSLITGVVIGNIKEEGRDTYVRLVSSDSVYVTSEAPWIKDRPIDYIDRKLISVDRLDIESVTVTFDDETYTLKAKNHSVLMENIPEGKEQRDNDCQRVLTALTNLRFNDVMSTAKAADEDLDFNRQYVCRLKDSTVYTIKIAKKIAKEDYKTYTMFDAEFTDKTPIKKEAGVESEEELKKKEAKLLARDKAKEFSAKHRGWVYEIVEYQAENLTKQLAELIKDKEEPEETVQAGEPNEPEPQQ